MKHMFVLLVALGFITLIYPASASAQKGLELTINGSLAVPTGDLADAAEMGFGGGVTVAKSMNSMLSLRGSVAYHTFGTKDIDLGGFGTVEGPQYAFIPVLVGAEYAFGASDMKPYAVGNIGYYLGAGDVEDNNLGFAIGAGFQMPMGGNNIKIETLYHYITSDGDAVTYLGVDIGYGFSLGM
ncbi:MAG: hypothetical protein D6675_03890 [Gemmatimonadetes bacterium]|nr:MAG: hypothetical protein D6675_03890 [Gemmatimonadota bacterium]